MLVCIVVSCVMVVVVVACVCTCVVVCIVALYLRVCLFLVGFGDGVCFVCSCLRVWLCEL